MRSRRHSEHGHRSELFAATTDPDVRPIDLGYRADDSPAYLGTTSGAEIAERFREAAPALGLVADISLDPADRFTPPEWAAFLNRCRGQLGTEAGGDYFSLTDEYRGAVNAFLQAQPDAPIEQVFDRFFRRYEGAVPIRIISGRNVEAAGTRTVQLLFEGEYDGYLGPDVHYIALRKDFANLDEAVEKFRDPRSAGGLPTPRTSSRCASSPTTDWWAASTTRSCRSRERRRPARARVAGRAGGAADAGMDAWRSGVRRRVAVWRAGRRFRSARPGARRARRGGIVKLQDLQVRFRGGVPLQRAVSGDEPSAERRHGAPAGRSAKARASSSIRTAWPIRRGTATGGRRENAPMAQLLAHCRSRLLSEPVLQSER